MDNETKSPLTPNQVVAHNLRRARKLRGWSQEQAARELEPYVGDLWSKATWSLAERSVTGSRIRHFSANDLVAFARCFDLPVTYFLLPEPGAYGQDAFLDTPDALPGRGLSAWEQLEIVFGTPGGQEDFLQRASEVVRHLNPIQQTQVQRSVDQHARLVEREVIGSVFKDVEEWKQSLTDLVDLLSTAQYEASVATDIQ